jgi:hypothetical protein
VDFAGMELEASLVLQMYEADDPLVPPGARAPTLRRAQKIADADLANTRITADLALRLPFYGRRQGTIRFGRTTDAQDMSCVVVGINWGRRSSGVTVMQLSESAVETWMNGGTGLCGTGDTLTGQYLHRVIHIGGGGDAQEAFDELAVFVWADIPGGGDVLVEAEAFGERVL